MLVCLSAQAQVVDDFYYNRSDARRSEMQQAEKQPQTERIQPATHARRIEFIDDTTGKAHPDTVRCIIRNADGDVLISKQQATNPTYIIVPTETYVEYREPVVWPWVAAGAVWGLWHLAWCFPF